MLINRDFHPEACVAKDKSRRHLANVHFDRQNSRVVSTDGHCLVVLPVTEIEDEDASGPVPPEAFKHARQNTPKAFPGARLRANGNVQCGVAFEVTLPRPDLDGLTFPAYEQVIPAPKEDDRVLGINVALLARVAKALGTDHVVLRIPAHPKTNGRTADCVLDPIRVTTSREPDASDPLGVVMPRRV
jgi:hypothetical protein